MAHDYGHIQTEKELEALERRISRVYREAGEELSKSITEYFDRLVELDKHQHALLMAGEITEEQYKQWRLNQIGRGARFEALRDAVAERYTNANETAVSYVNDATPGIYSLNRNYAAYTIEQQTGESVGFTLWDEQTVKRLIVEEPDLMPYYPAKKAIKRGIDLAWGKQQITKQITSGILQGESIGHLANRLRKNIPNMNRDSAIRTARTAATGAQNAGRMDSYAAAEKMGIEIQREWMSTLDNRTRHAHQMLDGQKRPIGKPFNVDGQEIMFPGDPAAKGYLVYNCRCTMISVVKDARGPSDGSLTYKEWETSKKTQKFVETNQESVTMDKKDSGGKTVQTIGRIDVEKYKAVSPDIRTDEVVITDERIQHIKERHPNDYERYVGYVREMIEKPQYILEDPAYGTAVILKEYASKEERFRMVLRLATSKDNPEYRNSVITFLKISKRNFDKYIRNKKILYKTE